MTFIGVDEKHAYFQTENEISRIPLSEISEHSPVVKDPDSFTIGKAAATESSARYIINRIKFNALEHPVNQLSQDQAPLAGD